MLSPINKFLLYILLTFFISTTSFSCALCHMDIPKARVDMKVYALPNKTRFKVTWEFEKMFVSRLMRYDLDENDKDKKKSFNLLMKDIILKKYPEKYFIKPMEHYANIVLNDSSVLTTQTVPIPIIYTNKIKYFF